MKDGTADRHAYQNIKFLIFNVNNIYSKINKLKYAISGQDSSKKRNYMLSAGRKFSVSETLENERENLYYKVEIILKELCFQKALRARKGTKHCVGNPHCQ